VTKIQSFVKMNLNFKHKI